MVSQLLKGQGLREMCVTFPRRGRPRQQWHPIGQQPHAFRWDAASRKRLLGDDAPGLWS